MNGEEMNDVEKDEDDIWWGVKQMNVEVNGDESDEEKWYEMEEEE